jgi:predicted dehydrogenase
MSAREAQAGTRRLGVAIVGCGLIGRRRAAAAAADPRTNVRVAVDTRIDATAEFEGSCDVGSDWRAVLTRDDVDIVVAATPNAVLADVATAALDAGKHVLIEKPMGRNLAEARAIHAAALRSAGVLHIGFNHRHHPAVHRAAALVHSGAIGALISIRARYGHGGRPGLEKEWRSSPELAGGGELLDQGVHIADLVHWLAGVPDSAFCVLQTAVWQIQPLEDNAFGLLRFASGVVAQMHVSMTQWKNLFSLEVHGTLGALLVDGLGGSYGPERLSHVVRAMAGGAPEVREEHFAGEDRSWDSEWAAFVARIEAGKPDHGAAEHGLAAMRIIDALYRSAAVGRPVTL